MSLAAALERAATALPDWGDSIRPANGDPQRLLDGLEPGGAACVLAWLLEQEPEAGEELALAWADRERGAAPIAAVDPSALAKRGRKALRRAQHRLRSRGVSVETRSEPTVARLPRLADDLESAVVSAPDPSGAQLVVLMESHPSGGVRLFQGAVDCERGVVDFAVLEATRSQGRKLMRDLGRSGRLAVSEAPRESVEALLVQCAEAQPADRALPHAFSESRARIARHAESARTPGELARQALGGDVDSALLRRVVEQITEGPLGPWPPPPETLREIAEKVRAASESRLLVDDQQRRSQVEDLLSDALDKRYAEPVGERTARRLEECAYVRWKQGDEDDAHALLAAARAFREQVPRHNPVARALLTRALGPVLEGLREEEKSSLLVRP